MEEFKLDTYLSEGIDTIVKGAIRASLKNPKESLYIARFAAASREAASLRADYESNGMHIPSFLICSITDRCNLNCKGCYARENHRKHINSYREQLKEEVWRRIFREAQDLGVSFILLAGGEPLLRQEVIEAASEYKKIMFPVFTNGTLIQEKNITLFDKHRNLLPVLSIEGDLTLTDSRRGSGVYTRLLSSMQSFREKSIFFGASVTVTKENLAYITDETFVKLLYEQGCKVIIYVEYVPVNAATEELALSEREREELDKRLLYARMQYQDMIMVSFPGDEKSSGGCLAAGRGFFHINSDGSAEPCPFSPYSDTNIKDCSLLEALQSPLFHKLSDENILLREHTGGCVLFEQEDLVKAVCNRI